MKAKFLLTIALFIGLQAFAQTPTPYYTGFDTPPQQAGWLTFRKGNTSTFNWTTGNYPNAYSPPRCASHDYPVGGVPTLVEDWWVSPSFNFSSGGAIDSMQVIVFSPSGNATGDDHFGVYLLSGSPDPATATVTLLMDMTNMVSNMATWNKISNVPVPPAAGSSYIAFKYTGKNNWFVPYLDNVNIDAFATPCPAPASITVTPSFLSASFTWPAVATAIGYEIVVDNSAASPTGAGNPTSGTSHTEPGLTLNTVYYAHVRANCGGGTYSSWTTQMFKTLGGPAPCLEPSNIQFAPLTNTEANVTWAANPNSEGYEYTLKQEDVTPTVSGTLTLYNGVNLTSLTPATKYYLFVRNRCQGVSTWIFSNWVSKEFFTHFPTGINTTANQDMNLYPNPATDVLQIEGLKHPSALQITDIIGKQYLQTKVTGSNVSLNINDIPAGLYLIKIVDAEGQVQTLKFQKQ